MSEIEGLSCVEVNRPISGSLCFKELLPAITSVDVPVVC
ncbi:hypothetical protein EDF67_104283 [Sphingobacterium sp. JUb78]|nr:hypothetical protein [Sphingobacterium kitahiroshimense]TCR11190.1 hypothetical protein EDF67_104283 [Sphingobacterium sp. JUb78]